MHFRGGHGVVGQFQLSTKTVETTQLSTIKFQLQQKLLKQVSTSTSFNRMTVDTSNFQQKRLNFQQNFPGFQQLSLKRDWKSAPAGFQQFCAVFLVHMEEVRRHLLALMLMKKRIGRG